jgi:hypothetical protein
MGSSPLVTEVFVEAGVALLVHDEHVRRRKLALFVHDRVGF